MSNIKAVNIKFYLYCTWQDIPPTYRLYVDDELVAERTYIWDNVEYVLQEDIPVNLDVEKPHTLRLEQTKPESGVFAIRDLHTPYHSINITIT